MTSKRDFSVDPVQVGEPATYCSGSDRYPVRVVEVSKGGHKIVLQHMTYGVKSGSAMDGSAEYWYSDNPSGLEFTATLRKDGRYRRIRCSNYGTVIIGVARAYRDPHF